jgi:hypothetical protein
MTQQTAPKCWGMILGWIRRDGMARMLMTGVVLTSIEWRMHFMGFVTVLQCVQCSSEIVGQLLLEQFNNEQPLEKLPK